MTRRKLGVLLAAVVVVSAVATAAAFANNNKAGFKTALPEMLMAGVDRSDVTIEKIISVGDTMPGGYMFEAIPDGISLQGKGQGKGRVDVFLNHETSTVPFPIPTGTQPTVEQTAQNDYDDSSLSVLALNQHSKGVLHGRTPITGAENWQRFCSNYLATEKEGFDRDILFLNEETPDTVNRSGIAWPLSAGGSNPDQAGYVVAYDIKSGDRKKIPGMGRHNHENNVAIPGFDDLVMLSGDDTFTTTPSQSQVYAYIAPDTDAVWNDEGHLYGFSSNDPAVQKYEDFNPLTGTPASITGKFVRIDDAIARGGQAGLEAVPGIFDFVRIEDIAYDKRNPNIVYLADSGRAASGPAAAGKSTNGRIWKMVLSESPDPNAPLNVTLSILVEGDDNATKTFREIHQADNLETTANSLLVTEDPSTNNQFLASEAGAHSARVWRVPLTSPGVAGTPEIVLAVDQSLDESSYDVDGDNVLPLPVPPIAPGRLGAWEASGIVDASSIWGPGWFLVDVQAHTLWMSKEPDPVNPGFTRKREGGQLLAVHIPNA
ncbi:MAG: hypothetical protein ACR2M2_06610 [Gaiellaceae bacterium]|nr:hypothetical protein [Actinomycetota bacterium]